MNLFIPASDEQRTAMLSRFIVENRAESMILAKQTDDWVVVGSMEKEGIFIKSLGHNNWVYSFNNVHHCTAYSERLGLRRNLTHLETPKLTEAIKHMKFEVTEKIHS
jgi:hypothetical protein